MRYAEMDFNVEWVMSFSEDEFVNNTSTSMYWSDPGYAVSDRVRKKRLRELWRLLDKTRKK